jgi:hypothetical protein
MRTSLDLVCSATRSPGVYVVTLDGEAVARDCAPFLAAARKLLNRGADPDSELSMRWQGSPHVAMRGRLGSVATLTVVEGLGGLRLATFEPYAGPGSSGWPTASDDHEGVHDHVLVRTKADGEKVPATTAAKKPKATQDLRNTEVY